MFSNKIKYYTMDEIEVHNKWDDFWVVIHRNVMNLTPMLKDRRDHWTNNLESLLAFGGKDISQQFEENGTPKTELSPVTGKLCLSFPPIMERARSEFCKTEGKFWSQDPKYYIGRLTKCARRVRIVNTLTGTANVMTVCDEDSIYDIQRKYAMLYNHHAGNYLWRRFSTRGANAGKLRMDCTLDQNGLFEKKCEQHDSPPASLYLYYTNDVTIA